MFPLDLVLVVSVFPNFKVVFWRPKFIIIIIIFYIDSYFVFIIIVVIAIIQKLIFLMCTGFTLGFA